MSLISIRERGLSAVLIAIAVILVLCLCWIPAMSLAQQAKDAPSRRVDAVEDRQDTTEWLLDRTDARFAQYEAKEDARLADLTAKVKENEKALAHDAQIEATVRSLATFFQWAGSIIGSALIGSLVWAGKRANALCNKVEELDNKVEILSNDHKRLNTGISKTRLAIIRLMRAKPDTSQITEDLVDDGPHES